MMVVIIEPATYGKNKICIAEHNSKTVAEEQSKSLAHINVFNYISVLVRTNDPSDGYCEIITWHPIKDIELKTFKR